ncbi:MAG: glycosyltransferase family 2 protein [Armatimonadetes bacterium]|nr:glycosyltransferase family 2 protein [Armatimonadota bacterium]
MTAPEFSIVIPTFNRRDSLMETLSCLGRLRYSRNLYEVLVVDDGSTDGTCEALGSRAEAAAFRLRCLRQDRQGAGAARNRGIREAEGELCFFLDDDVLAWPDLLSEHHESHRGEVRALVRGPVINIPALPVPCEPPSLWQHYSMNYLCTSNASLRREHLLEAGLFDENFERWEDAELGVRLKQIGVRRKFNLKAFVHHLKPPVPVRKQLAIAGDDGRSAARLYRRYPSLGMRLRTGLHGLNYLRSELLTAAPLQRLYQTWMQGYPEGKVARLAQSLLREREYLRSGRAELRGI